MSYEDSEISVSGAKPVELYKFVGTYANYFYTSGPELINFLGDDYVPLTIKRSEVSAGTQEDDGLDISIEIPATSEMAQTYGFSQTPPRLALTIFRYHRDAPGNYVAYWTGPVTNIQTSDGKSNLRSPSTLANALAANVPNVYYQTPCNHVLFDARCAQVEADFTVVTVTTVVSGKDITVLSIGAFDGMYVGGELSLTSGERRMIVAQAGNVVTVNFPFFNVGVGDAVALVVGCDHAYNGDCKTRFDNQDRFGGFPFIPSDNVFQTGMEPGTDYLSDLNCVSDNLGFEDGLTGWTIVGGGAAAVNFGGDDSRHGGALMLKAGTAAYNAAYKIISIAGPTALQVDDGLYELESWGAFHAIYNLQTDHGRLFVRFYDATNTLISEELGAYDYSHDWTFLTMPTVPVPALTRSIHWGCESVRDEGANNDNYWDDFTLARLNRI